MLDKIENPISLKKKQNLLNEKKNLNFFFWIWPGSKIFYKRFAKIK